MCSYFHTSWLLDVYIFQLTYFILYPFQDECSFEARNKSSILDGLEDPEIPLATVVAQPDAVTTAENVDFHDAAPTHEADIGGYMDVTRTESMRGDLGLDDFFSRPLRLSSIEMAMGQSYSYTVNPWDYFKNPRVVNRINNYKLLEATMKVKFVINGNPFIYGRLLCSYLPYPGSDQFTLTRLGNQEDLVAQSQRPHVYLNPCESEGGTMECPFFNVQNQADNVAGDIDDLGFVYIRTINPLKHANGATDSVTVNVFVWAENVKFDVPTNTNNINVVPQATSEYMLGPVSKPASAVARIASSLRSVPWLRPYALATEIGAQAVGRIASMFGYCKPLILDSEIYRPVNRNSTAVCNNRDDSLKLAIDGKQELTIDPRVTGLSDPRDELSLTYIAGIESYLDTFKWIESGAPESRLWSSVVDPGIHRMENTSKKRYFTAPCFASVPFKYWKGSMKFRFQVVCSKYHRGRLKVVYDPHSSASQAEYNTAYTTIVDISDNTDFTVTCGWGNHLKYRESAPLLDSIGGYFAEAGNITPAYNSSTQPWGNGTISVYVVNELTTPNSTVNNDISINVYVSMADDVEFAVPDDTILPNLVTFPSTPNPFDAVPDAATVEEPTNSDVNNDTDANTTPNDNTYFAGYTTNDAVNHVHFGECITSFRTLLKRYSLHEILPLFHNAFARTLSGPIHFDWAIMRNMLPFEPGATNGGGGYTDSLTLNTPAGETYAYAYMTPVRYVTLAFAGWRGGMRYNICRDSRRGGWSSRASVQRDPTGVVPSNLFAVPNDNNGTVGWYKYNIQNYERATMQNGGLEASTEVNRVMAVELPYQTNYRFSLARKRTKFDPPALEGIESQPGWSMVTKGFADPTWYGECAAVSVAAAEDFNCHFWVGPPPFFFELDRPG